MPYRPPSRSWHPYNARTKQVVCGWGGGEGERPDLVMETQKLDSFWPRRKICSAGKIAGSALFWHDWEFVSA